MSKAATEAALSELHGDLAREMTRKLKDKETTAADLSVIRQFLRDNGIQAQRGDQPDSPMRRLEEALPSFPEGDEEDFRF